MLFFDLLQVAIGNRKELSQTPTAEEWRELYDLAQKQTLVGIALRGIELLPEAQHPSKPLLMKWCIEVQRIKALNAAIDRKVLMVVNKFLEEGFPGLVLKGQGIAQLYRVGQIDNGQLIMENDHIVDNLSIVNCQLSIKEYRTPGDVDIWLHASREEILKYVRSYVPHCTPVYLHVDFPVVDGLSIEVHFTPSWMNSPVTNRRLQQWFRESAGTLFAKNENVNDDENRLPDGSSQRVYNYSEIPSPNLAFNRVYILVHIYRHLFHEGIGLRQLLDYYFVLQQGFTEEERAETMRTLRSLSMQRFTAAVMWVLQHVYGMDDRYLLTPPDEREGRFLLNEIMLAGNFGHYDERLQHERGETSIHWALRKIKRNFRFLGSYPSEVLWSPFWKIWHWCWRKAKGYL